MGHKALQTHQGVSAHAYAANILAPHAGTCLNIQYLLCARSCTVDASTVTVVIDQTVHNPCVVFHPPHACDAA